MSSNVEEAIIERIRALSTEQQRTVLEFVKGIPERERPRRMPIFEEIDVITADVPAEAWDEVPKDGSINIDHYLYGAPKK